MADEHVMNVIPTPQHAHAEGSPLPAGTVAVTGSERDEWAMTVLRDGLSERAIPLSAEIPSGPHTELRIVRESAAGLAERARALGISVEADRIGPEGYVLAFENGSGSAVATLASVSGAGQSYGVDTFLQLISGTGGDARIQPTQVVDWPSMRMRVYGGAKGSDFAARQRFNMVRGGGSKEDIAELRKRHLEPWGSIHPSHAAATQPGLRYSDPAAVEAAIKPLVEAAERGVLWHSLSFDDIDLKLSWPDDIEKFGTIGNAHVDFVNNTLARLRQVNPDANLIVIPIIYANGWLGGTWVYAVDEDEIYDYLTTLGGQADPSVVFVWTGENVESMGMTDDDLHQWIELVQRKPLVFENAPCADVTDFGALRDRTANAGELCEGWIYIHRGPLAEIAEYSTAEFIWNPVAYETGAAYDRALHTIAGENAAPALRRLVDVYRDQGDARYRQPIWREGRILEVADPCDAALADFYVNRLQVIGETLPVLDGELDHSDFYRALRDHVLKSVDVASAYLETYVMLQSMEHGETGHAIEAGDRTETLYEEWTRYSTGSTDLNADTERRDALTYIEQIGVAGKLRALRRGGESPIAWIQPEPAETRHGRPCAVLTGSGDAIELVVDVQGSNPWLAITASGAEDAQVSATLDGTPVDVSKCAWIPGRWRTCAVPLHGGSGECVIRFTVDAETGWALARIAVLEDPAPEQILHATRSAARLGASETLSEPTRYTREAETDAVSGRVAVRQDLAVIRPVSGTFYDLAPETRVGQTFHVTTPEERSASIKDAIGLYSRESEDGDLLFGIGMHFQRAGTTPLRLTLWRWAGSVSETTGAPGNHIAESEGTMDTPFGTSRHVCFFPLGDETGVELDPGAACYFEISAPDGWDGWRVRRSFGWYGERYDARRSGYLNGEIEAGVDTPFRTYVLDTYSAEWR